MPGNLSFIFDHPMISKTVKSYNSSWHVLSFDT